VDRDAFHRAMAGRRVVDIEEVADVVLANPGKPDEQEIVREWAKATGRNLMGQYKEDKRRVYHSVTVRDDDGTKRQVYMMEQFEQMTLLDRDEFQQIANQYADRAKYNAAQAKAVKERGEAATGKHIFVMPEVEQLALAFDDEEDEEDVA
jgi:hypothetical protein